MSRLVALLVTLAAQSKADRIVVHVPGLPDSPLFSHAIISHNVIYLAGTVGVNLTAAANGGTYTLCAGGIQPQT
eukprot:668868-Prymnesium_polylepis.2